MYGREKPTSIQFRAENLFYKYGFNDGDILDDFDDGSERFWQDGEYLPYDLFTLDHMALIVIVENFLLPFCPPHLKTFRISSTHNPIRFELSLEERNREEEKFDKNLLIELSVSDIQDIFNALTNENYILPDVLNRIKGNLKLEKT